MSKLLPELIHDVRLRIPDLEIDESEIESFVLEAVKDFSRFRPQILQVDFTGDGKAYQFPLPATFEVGFSTIINVEYPQGERIPRYLKGYEWIVYKDGTAMKLHLLTVVPQSGKKIRVNYTARHEVSDTSSTLAIADEETIIVCACALMAQALAAHAASTQASALAEETVNWLERRAHYTSLAEEYRRIYQARLGFRLDEIVPSAFAAARVPMARERILLTHQRRFE